MKLLFILILFFQNPWGDVINRDSLDQQIESLYNTPDYEFQEWQDDILIQMRMISHRDTFLAYLPHLEERLIEKNEFDSLSRDFFQYLESNNITWKNFFLDFLLYYKDEEKYSQDLEDLVYEIDLKCQELKTNSNIDEQFILIGECPGMPPDDPLMIEKRAIQLNMVCLDNKYLSRKKFNDLWEKILQE